MAHPVLLSARGRVQQLFRCRSNRRLWHARPVELDTAQIRAFVAAADTGSLSRAAAQLHLSQQALSKRIARLEATVGVLFDRGSSGVSLTPRGSRFLPDARDLLAVADAALASVRGDRIGPLHVDVWGHLHPPHALVQAFASARPDVIVELSMRRNLLQALTALQRREIDAATGNVTGLAEPLPPELTCELVTTTPLAALVHQRSTLATRATITPDDLRQHRLWWPTQPGSVELNRFATDYAASIGVHLLTEGRNLGLDALVAEIQADPTTVTIVSTDWPIPAASATRLVPIRPMPYYPWYLIWPKTAAHPLLPALRHSLRTAGRIPDSNADDVWLPAVNR
jgi:DNA-binding transcriptional LysR family regulator